MQLVSLNLLGLSQAATKFSRLLWIENSNMVTSLPPSLIHAHILTFLPHSCTQGYLKLSVQVLSPGNNPLKSVDIEGYVHHFSVNEFYVLNCTLKHIAHPYIPTLPSPHTYTHTYTHVHTYTHTHTHTQQPPPSLRRASGASNNEHSLEDLPQMDTGYFEGVE